MHIPAGAIGLTKPRTFFGRLIAWRQGVPFSHCVVSLGNGKVTHSTLWWTATTPESKWKGVTTWWVPTQPYSDEEARVLRSVAYMCHKRIKYALGLFTGILAFVVFGRPLKRGHNLFCTYYGAELALTVRNFDFSAAERPWLVDPATMLAVLEKSSEYRRLDAR